MTNKTKKLSTKIGKKKIINAKTKIIDIKNGEDLIVLLNETQAWEHGISATDKASMIIWWVELVFDVDLTHKYVDINEVGITRDVSEKYNIQSGEKVQLHFTTTSTKAMEALKKAIKWQKLHYDETYSIMKDISDNRFTDTLTTYYSAIWFFKTSTDNELFEMAKAMWETGEMLKFKGVVADKHCMGWVPGNETTMIIIPLLASLGIKMPKTFSKSITTPAATWECVNVLMDISFSKKEIEDLVKKNNSCLVWGGGLSLAPADEKLIKVAYPLSMQSYSRTVVSIMAKKYAMGITHSLIDIPVWPTAKVPDKKTGELLKKKYEYVGKKLGMKVRVELTEAKEPIGAWIGPHLQVREVLRVLQQHEKRPLDLEKKSLHLCAVIIELVGMAKWKAAYDIAYKQLVSGKAWAKMQKIIIAQRGKNPNIYSEDLLLWTHTKEITAKKDGIIKEIDLQEVNLIARTLWSPIEEEVGIYFAKKLGNRVKKWDILFTLYANDVSKLDIALEVLKEKEMITIG